MQVVIKCIAKFVSLNFLNFEVLFKIIHKLLCEKKKHKLLKGEENILPCFVFFKIKFIVKKIFAIKREPGRKESKRYLFATDQINKDISFSYRE